MLKIDKMCVTFEETPDVDSDSHLDQLMFFLSFLYITISQDL